MDAVQEAAFERKAQRELKGHRGLQSGRDFRWNTFRYQKAPGEVIEKYDQAFPNAPDSKKWWGRFCPGCGLLPCHCKCEKPGLHISKDGMKFV